jgi:AraC-like DNA-binding protein
MVVGIHVLYKSVKSGVNGTHYAKLRLVRTTAFMINKLFIDFKHALFVGHLDAIKHHKHTTGALCISLGEKLVVKKRDEEYRSRVLYIEQNTDFEMLSSSPVVIYCFELNAQQRALIGQQLGIDVTPIHHKFANEDVFVKAGQWLGESKTLNMQHVLRFLDLLGINKTEQEKADKRIDKLIETLHAAPTHKFTIDELTQHASLSKTRLSELFKSTTGLTLRRYRIWQRLIVAAELASKGYDLTYCAQQAGFSDSAHLSNSCRKLLGVSPIELLSQPRQLHIFTPTQLS